MKFQYFVIFISLCLLTGVVSAGWVWTEQNTSSGWEARQWHSTVALPNGNIVITGGYSNTGDSNYNDTWRSTNNGSTWTRMNASSGWGRRFGHTTLALSDNKIVLMGGMVDLSYYSNDVWQSTDQGTTWTKTKSNNSDGWSARHLHTSVLLSDGSIVLMGGWATGPTYKNDTWRSTDNGSTWTLQNASSGWSPRYVSSSVVLSDDSILLIGGFDGYTNAPVSDVWKSTDKGVTWKQIKPDDGLGFGYRYGHSSIVTGNYILIFGGRTSPSYNALNDQWLSTDGGVTWIELSNAGWYPRTYQKVVRLPSGDVLGVGGYADNFGTYKNDTWKGTYIQPVANFSSIATYLDASFTNTSIGSPLGWAWFFGDEQYNQQWFEQNSSGGWGQRQGFGTVVLPDGSIVITSGGRSGDSYYNDTWRSTDKGVTWKLQNASSGWMVRMASSAVSLPDGSIVLTGGSTYGVITELNDTWRSTDQGVTWVRQNASSGWAARGNHHTMVLSDGSIVLIGGNTFSIYLNDTWRSTDKGVTWVRQTLNANWSARSSFASVVLSDDSIIVMGGVDTTGRLSEVWRSIDNGITWIQQNTGTIWSPRFDLESVALPNGSILIMGGNDGSEKNDVWLSQNKGVTWTQMDSSTEWSGRSNFDSVLLPDGSVIVIGGESGGTTVNDTWRMNPVGSSINNPDHLYTYGGIYNVTLQIFDGQNISIKRDTITVIPEPPVADFTWITTYLNAAFTDTSSGFITSWAWFFGDEPYNNTWVQQNASSTWEVRTEAGSVALSDGSIVLLGGSNTLSGMVYMNDTWRSTDNGVTWKLQNATPSWISRWSHSVVVLPDDSIVLMGGWKTPVGPYNDTWRSTDKGITWTLQNASSGWEARKGFTSAVLSDGSIVIMGGDKGSDNYFNDTWRSTDKGVTWARMNASGGWASRELLTSVALSDGSVVIMNGYGLLAYYSDVWRSINNGSTWIRQTADAGWGGRQSSTSHVLPDDSIILIGGSGVAINHDIWRSVDKGVTWTQMDSSTEWSGRSGHTSVILPDSSIVLMGGGGTGGVGGYYNDTWRVQLFGSSSQDPSHDYVLPGTYNVTLQLFNGFNMSKITHQVTVTQPPPNADFTHTSVDLDASFTDTSTGSPTGWAWFFGDELYNQNWVQRNASGGWSARSWHTSAVLPNGNIIIMGGDDGDRKNDTWRSTDKGLTWQLMNMSGGWEKRRAACSVGLQNGNIILMGGYNRNGIGPYIYLNDTWRSTDEGATWQLMNGSSGWSKRLDASCVASTDSIILMGGYDGSTKRNDTWRSTDDGATWELMNMSSGWDARSGHTSTLLQDGNVVLFGGFDNNFEDRNDTWRSTDEGLTWQLMNGSSGWGSKKYFQSISSLDGSILVIGGSDDHWVYYNDTWRSTDEGLTWINITNNPGWISRQKFTSAVLSDGSVVIIGGYDYEGDLKNDTWRFDPAGSHLQNPSHTYALDGIYNVTLQVYNALTYNSTQKQIVITLSASLVNFTSDVTSGLPPLDVQFYDTSEGTPTSWAWFFGDTPYIEQWQVKNMSSGWAGREEQNLVLLPDGSIVVLAGYGRSISVEYPHTTMFNDVWRSMDNGSTWTEMTPPMIFNESGYVSGGAEWGPNDDPMSVALSNGHIIIMGGYKNTSISEGPYSYTTHYVNDTWRSIDNGAHWTLMNASGGWKERGYAGAVALPNDHIILMGGYGVWWDPIREFNDTWRSVDEGATWQLMNSSPGWQPRGYPASVVLPDSSILLVGGWGDDVFNDTWRSTDEGATWVQQTDRAEWEAVGSNGEPAVAALSDGTIIMMQGNGGDDDNQTWVSSDQGVHWTRLMDAPFLGRYVPSIVAMPDDSIIYVAGWGQYPSNETWQFKVPDSIEQNPSHTYNGTIGQTFNVSLEAGDFTTYDYIEKPYYILLAESLVDFTSNVTSGLSPLAVQFNDTSINSPSVWAWFFGDEPNNKLWVEQTANAEWAERAEQNTVVLSNGHIITLMGYNSSQNFNDTWRSIDDGITWQLMNGSSGWSQREFGATVALPNDHIVLMGGYVENETYNGNVNDTWRSIDEGVTWQLMNGSSGWFPTSYATSVALPNGNIILMGGYVEGKGSFSNYYTNDTWRSTDEGATWQLINDSSGWTGREEPASVVLPDGSIVLVGGWDDDNGNTNDTWRSTDEGVTWVQQTAGAEWEWRDYHAAAVLTDGSIILMGGSTDSGYVNDTWRSTDQGIHWVRLFNAPWQPRYLPNLVTLSDNNLLFMGGRNYNDVWKFSLPNSIEQNPVHTYTGATSQTLFNVSLQAGDFSDYGYIEKLYYINLTGIISTAAPFARFTASSPSGYLLGDVLTGSMPFTVTFNDTSVNGTPTNWSWSFGDGTYSSQQNNTHIYTVNNTYLVTLVAGNEYGSSSYSRNITVTPKLPLANFTVSPNVGSVPLAVSFTDTSTGVSIINWSWIFGDGSTSYLRNPVHTYVTNGTYYTRLSVTTITGDYNISQPIPIYVVLNQVPMVDFIGSPLYGSSPLSIQFIDESTSLNGIKGWNWSFGDGDYTNSTSQNPLHIYQSPGQYSVTLVVLSNDDYTNYTSKIGYVNVEVPINTVSANFVATPTYSPTVPVTIQFNDISVCNPICTNWAWDFNGDGSVESVLQNPVYTYTYPGNYSPKLVASNGINAGTKIRGLYITVGPTFVQPTMTQPTNQWIPGYSYNGSIYAFKGNTNIDLPNSTYLKYWLQNLTSTGDFDIYGFSVAVVAPLMHVFGFWIFLMIWGLYLFAVWIRSQDVTMPLVIGIISMGTFGLLFPKESLPVIIIMFVVCGAIIITKLMKDSI